MTRHVSVRNVEEAATRRGLGDSGTLAKGAGLAFAGAVTAQVIGMCYQAFIARTLGAAQFGLYALGWTLVRILSPVTTLGLDAGVMYFGARYLYSSAPRFRGVVRYAISLSALSGAGVGVALYLLAPLLARRVFHKPEASLVISSFAIAFPLYGVFLVGAAITRLTHRMQYAVLSGLTLSSSALVFLCISFVFHLGLRGAVLSMVGGILVGLLVALSFARRLFPTIFSTRSDQYREAGDLLGYSLPLVCSGLAVSMLAFVDRLFVARFCSLTDTGIYQVASQLSISFALAQGAFDNIFSPMVADLHARSEHARLVELYRVCSKWGLYISMLILVMVLSARVEIIELVFGQPYAAAEAPLLILALGKTFMMTTAVGGPMLVMTGHQRLYATIPIAVLLVELALNFFLVPSFGLAGAAAATATGCVLLHSATITSVRRTIGMWPFDRRHLKPVIAASVAVALLYIVPPLHPGSPMLGLLKAAALTLLAFIGTLGALGVDHEDRDILNSLRGRLRLRLAEAAAEG